MTADGKTHAASSMSDTSGTSDGARTVTLDRPGASIEPLVALASLARGGEVVALTGAGMSTDSGIPDYRSPASLLRVRRPIQGPEFVRSAKVRQRYWARAVVGWARFCEAAPNDGHRALAALEADGKVRALITQNVDRLHQRAGSRRVIELHGALEEVACLACGAHESRDALQLRLLARNPRWATWPVPGAPNSMRAQDAPDGDAELADADAEGFEVLGCAACDGVLKPRVVFFGDSVARPIVEDAFAQVDRASLLLVLGTSLTVFSGYRFMLRAHERNVPIAIVNRGPVRGEERATLTIEAGTTETLRALRAALAPRHVRTE